MPENEERAKLLRDTGEEILKLMCDRASPDQWGKWLTAPLQHAAGAANHDLVGKLLRAGAPVDARWRDCRGNTLLHAGAEGGNAQLVRALIRTGADADVDAQNDVTGSTPLHLAVLGGKETVAKALIMAGADVNIRKDTNDAPLHLAIEGGHGGLAEALLLCGADPRAADCNGRYPIHRAAFQGLDQAVLALAQKGVDLNSLKGGLTPLSIAAQQNHLSTVGILVAEGADPNVPMQNSLTVLHRAVNYDKASIISALIDGGANIEALSGRSRTPLYYAAWSGSCVAMLRLLQLGARVNTKTSNGWTALHVACRFGKADAADLLLRWGADETALNKSGKTPGAKIPSIDRAPEGDRPRLERLSKLLAHAPQDRSWRRRGFVVMCRAHQDRLRLSVEVFDGAAEAAGRPEEPPPSRRPRTAQVKVEVEVCARGRASGSSVRAQKRAERDGSGGGFDGVAAWLMGVPDAAVFRKILGFL